MGTRPPLYLVTGAAGFVAGYLIERLTSQGVRVRAMVRKDAQAETLRGLIEEVVIADLTDEDSLPRAVDGVTGVYHIAGLFRQEKVDATAFYEVNTEGTRRMLDASIAAGVSRFVHCSTVGVHGDIKNPPADEEAPFAAGDLYQTTKLAGEKFALQYFRDERIRGVVIRPAMVYGPGDTRTLKLFKMIAKGTFFYVGDGSNLLHWVDVRDLVAGIQLAMNAEEINGEVYILSGETSRSLKEVVEIIARQLGVSSPRLHIPAGLMLGVAGLVEGICKPLGIEPPLYKRRVGFFLNNRCFDSSKARRDLGYKPAQSLEDEIADIIAEYKRRGDL
jgi:nucleoside-diphosphate-sugar epimerase